jgi:methionyl aminopeptidase
MINMGKPETRTLADDWTAVTRDGSLSAQWEHTIALTKNGIEILTLPR